MWANAYLEQARSDWETRDVVCKNGCAACHELHYLQMASEKLAKAALLRSGTPLDRVAKSHQAFARFLRVASRNSSLQQRLGFKAHQLQAYIHEVLPIADQIERLAPQLARGGPNAEYPWETSRKQVIAPVSHGFSIMHDLGQSQGRKLLRLVSIILCEFEGLF